MTIVLPFTYLRVQTLMPHENTMPHLDARAAAHDVARWFFEEMADAFDALKVPLAKRAATAPKFSEQLWAKMLVDAIASFNQGLDDFETDGKRASIDPKLYERALNLVGNEAFGTIAFLVTAAEMRRPLQLVLQQLTQMFMKAQEIYQGAVSRQNDQQALFQAKNQIDGLIQQAGALGPEINDAQAQNILQELGTMRAQLEQFENKALSAPLSTMTAPAQQSVGTLPKGVRIGRRVGQVR